MRSLRLGLSLMVVAIFVLLAFTAQAVTTTIASGTVKDQAGQATVNMPVECHNANSSFSLSATSDSSGQFTCSGDTSTLAVGTTIIVEARPPAGYNAEQATTFTWNGTAQTGITLTVVATTKTINITIHDDLGQDVTADVTVQPINVEPGENVAQSIDTVAGTGSVDISFPDGLVSVDANISDTNAESYPWMEIGGPQAVHFTDDTSIESTDLDFTVVHSDTKAKVKMLDKNGDILTQNDFNGDIYFNGYNDTYGSISTRRKVDSSTGMVTVYLLPGVWHVSAIHQQLDGQSFDPDEVSFVLSDEAGTTDWGTVQAQDDSGELSGTVSFTSDTAVTAVTTDTTTVEVTNLDTNQRYSTPVAADNTFQFSDMAFGTYTVTVVGDDVLPDQTASVELTNKKSTVSQVKLKANVANTTIAGQLLDSSGAAVENFTGTVVLTTQAGEYTAPVESDGSYEIPLYNGGVDGTDATLTLVTQPGADGYASNQTVTIADGDITEDFTLKTNEATITGQMRDSDGDDVTVTQLGDDAKMMAINADTGSVEMADIATDGSFSLEVGPGIWNLVPRFPDTDTEVYAGNVSSKAVDVSAGETVDTNVAVLEKTATITGTVTDTSGDAVAEAPVVLTNLPALQAAGGTVDPSDIVTLTTTTNSKGEISVDAPPGDYTLTFGTNPDTADVLAPASMDVTAKADKDTSFSAEFRETTADIKGTLTDHFTSATVTAYSADGGSVTADVGKDGSYDLALTPGDWDVTVTGVKGGELYLQETMVTVGSGDTTVSFDPKPTGIDFPAMASVTGAADENISVSNSAGASVDLPAFAAAYSGDLTVTLAPVVAMNHTGDISQVGLSYDVRVLDENDIPITSLNKDATVTLPLDNSLTGDVTNGEMTASYFNDSLQTNLFDGIVGDVQDDQLVIQTKHFSRFAATTTGQVISTPNKVKGSSLKAKAIQATQATLQWLKPAHTAVRFYTVQVRPSGVDKVKQWKTYTVKKLHTVIKKLSGQTAYDFRVRACNQFACSDYTDWKTFTTN